MFKKKQLIVIMFLLVWFSACNKSTYSIAAPGTAIPHTKLTTGNNEAGIVDTGITFTVTNF